MVTKGAAFALLVGFTTVLAAPFAAPAPTTFITVPTPPSSAAHITAGPLSTPAPTMLKREDPAYCTSEGVIFHCNENEDAIPSFPPITAVPLDLFGGGDTPFKAKMARDERSDIMQYVKDNGFHTVKDAYGTNIRFEVVPTVVTVLNALGIGYNERCTPTVGVSTGVTYAILYDGTGTPTAFLPATVTEYKHGSFECPMTPSWG